MTTTRKIRWGILSTANIGMAKVIPAIQKSTHSQVVAIASRDLAKAQAAAARLGIATAYGSYEELCADPDIDAIYNPLPNHLHVPMTLAAARAGKHVLCEKPIALHARDAEALPQIPAGTDRLASVLADFGNGRQLSFICSTQAAAHQRVQVLGTKAKLEITIPFNAPPDEHTAITIDSSSNLDGSLARREILPAIDQYTQQAEAFALAVLGEQPLPWGIDDAIASMRVLDAVVVSEKTEGWATV